jgi:Family of unknown function (DUF5372)
VLLAGRFCLPEQRQLEVTAPLCSQPSGYVEITHPFHPLFRQQFLVLKFRTVFRVECVVLKGSPSGTFSVRRDWTSLSSHDHYQDAGVPPRILRLESLLELSKLVAAISKSISKS